MVISIDWKKIREGDKKMFDKSFDLHYLPLCAFISKYINEKSVIEDLVIDCFAKIWENRQSLNIKSSFQNYLVTMVKNSAISYLRKHQFQISDVENISNLLIEDETDPLEDSDILNKLHDAINRLPEQRRIILRKAAFDDKSYAEIAEELHITVNTVKTQMARSYRFLRSELNVSQNVIYGLLFV
jgi:RNA polymerase sigma-70 factor (ECF subfamily)